MRNDLSFDMPDGKYNYRVGAIIINNGRLLMVKGLDPYYYTVGGRVALHESTEEAVVREVFEETGITCEVERLAFVHEVFFTLRNNGVRFHELGFYFIIKPNASLGAIAARQPLRDSAGDYFEWLLLNELGEIDLYPLFFKTKLQNLSGGIEHIVEQQ